MHIEILIGMQDVRIVYEDLITENRKAQIIKNKKKSLETLKDL